MLTVLFLYFWYSAALSEELENPMNVHRWRKLEGSDPATYEMIQKIQTLQKRLIMKTEEVVEKDLLIQEKEKLYVELKNILARQPGPEVAEQLSVYQHNLKEKVRCHQQSLSSILFVPRQLCNCIIVPIHGYSPIEMSDHLSLSLSFLPSDTANESHGERIEHAPSTSERTSF